MLVLSRKKNESIVVNDVIVITVVEIRGDKVRLGIEAPREVPIHRSEVFAAIQASGQIVGNEVVLPMESIGQNGSHDAASPGNDPNAASSCEDEADPQPLPR